MFEFLKRKKKTEPKDLFEKFQTQLTPLAKSLFSEKFYSDSIKDAIVVEKRLMIIWNANLVEELGKYKALDQEKEFFKMVADQACTETYHAVLKTYKDDTDLVNPDLKKFQNYLISNNKLVVMSSEAAAAFMDDPRFIYNNNTEAHQEFFCLNYIGTFGNSRLYVDPYLTPEAAYFLPETLLNFKLTLGGDYTNPNTTGKYINATININPNGSAIKLQDEKLKPFGLIDWNRDPL